MLDSPMALSLPLQDQFETLFPYEHLCPVCGNILQLCSANAISRELAHDWNLTAQQRRFFDYREGCTCKSCGSSVRRMNFAKVFLETINLQHNEDIQFLCDLPTMTALDTIKIAEINNCGNLHSYFSVFPSLAYSEYGSNLPNVPSEDLMSLSYPDHQFDVVLTSDVLEHVPDYHRALSEIHRVLKLTGTLIFTVPWLSDRKTIARAKITPAGQIEHLQSPSYHGDYTLKLPDHLVFHEFGFDFVDVLNQFFETKIHCSNSFGGLIPSVFMCRKVTHTL